MNWPTIDRKILLGLCLIAIVGISGLLSYAWLASSAVGFGDLKGLNDLLSVAVVVTVTVTATTSGGNSISPPAIQNRCSIYWYSFLWGSSACNVDEVNLPSYHWSVNRNQIVFFIPNDDQHGADEKRLIQSWWDASVEYQRRFGGPSFYDFYQPVFISDPALPHDVNFLVGGSTTCGVAGCTPINIGGNGDMTSATVEVGSQAYSFR